MTMGQIVKCPPYAEQYMAAQLEQSFPPRPDPIALPAPPISNTRSDLTTRKPTHCQRQLTFLSLAPKLTVVLLAKRSRSKGDHD